MENYYISFLALLSTYCIPGTVSGSEDIAMNKQTKIPEFVEFTFLLI